MRPSASSTLTTASACPAAWTSAQISQQSITLYPVTGLPEFTPGMSLAPRILEQIELAEGDILVVTSKIISKIENRIIEVPRDPALRDEFRQHLILQEAKRVVAKNGKTLITENHLGVVQAASGIDGSNVDSDKLLLLPLDPDASARQLRAELYALCQKNIAVIITDTMGRAWRTGQIDMAIGSAGIRSSVNYQGVYDPHGNELQVTDVAIIDELASAADLVKGKVAEIPIALIRGYQFIVDETATAKDLIRESSLDLFGQGVAEARAQGQCEAILLRKSIREFSDQSVDLSLIQQVVQEALTAPAPHHSHPIHYVLVREHKAALLHALQEKWKHDLNGDGFSPENISRRIARGNILWDAPEIIVPFMELSAAHSYPDETRNNYERTMFTIAGGASVGSLLIALAAHGLGSCWIGSTIFAPEITTEVLQLSENWIPLGAIAVGYPITPNTPRHISEIHPLIIR